MQVGAVAWGRMEGQDQGTGKVGFGKGWGQFLLWVRKEEENG